jgi:two-component SAPR family response regulator
VKLRADVTCDWHDFKELVGRGFAAGEAGLPELEAALSLVEGRPFLGIDPRRYTWAERQIQEMVSLIVDVTEKAGASLLAAGQPSRAFDAVSVGLTVDATNESLLRLGVAAGVAAGRSDAAVRLRDRFLADLEAILGDVNLTPETSKALASLRC